MKKVIVTGATGSIGCSLIEKLLKNNTEVIAIVRPNSKNIRNLKKNKNLTIIESDISAILEVKELINGTIDTIYHFAWDGTTGSDRYDIEKQSINIKSTIDIVELAQFVNCKKIIFSGSQAEYGPKDEKIYTSSKPNPNTAYGMAKYISGLIFQKMCLQAGIDFIWARIFSVYGPMESDKTMIKSTLKKMLSNEEVNLTQCIQLWEYIYIDDMVNALILLGLSGKKGIYNISSNDTKPLKDYIIQMYEITKSKSKMNFGAIPYKDGIINLNSDISEITSLGFKEEYTFEDGIKRILNHERSE